MYLNWSKELAHQEMIAAIIYQLTRNLTPEQIREGGFDAYFVDHTTGIYPQAASGTPFSTATLQCTGDPMTDLFEDLAAEGASCTPQPKTARTPLLSRYVRLRHAVRPRSGE